MPESYRFTWQGGTGELIEKKSRFIATVSPVKSEEEAQRFIEQIKKQYWDARHNCTAFTIGSRHQLTRCSDDGEPAGTAGRPMLDVLLGEDIHDTCVVVTRYFGGTLLGTGGLVRAYSGAVQEALKASVILERQKGIRLNSFRLWRYRKNTVPDWTESASGSVLLLYGFRFAGSTRAGIPF